MLSSTVKGISKGFLFCLKKFTVEGRELAGEFGGVHASELVRDPSYL